MRRFGAASAVFVVVALAACSSGSSRATVPKPTTPRGTLDLGVVGLGSLDPLMNSGPASVMFDRLVYQPLVGVNPRTSAPTPLVARRWTANRAQTEFTFTLDPTAKFHDGTPVTAADVVTTLVRAKFLGGSVAALLVDVPGDGIVALDTTTLLVKSSTPDADLPAKLSNPALGIMSAASARRDAASLRTTAVGSGPFRVKSSSATLIELVRATSHGPGGDAALDRIVVHRYATGAESATAFSKRQVDVAWVGNEPWESVRSASSAVGARPYLAVGYYGLNLADPLLADARFRAAIVLAIDPQKVARAGFGADAVAATGVVSRAVPGALSNACARICGPDAKRSRELVTAVFPNGGVPALNIDFEETPTQRAIVTELVKELSAAGIPTAPRPHDAKDYPTFLASGAAQIFRSGWASDAPTAYSFVNPPFWPSAPENITTVKTDALSAALAAAAAAPSAKERAAKSVAAEQTMLTQYAVIPIVQYETRVAVATTVRGVRVDAFGSFDPTNVTGTG